VIAVLFLLLILLVVTAAGVWGVDSRDGGDWSSPGAGPFRSERRFD
jgi:hypothetical protein